MRYPDGREYKPNKNKIRKSNIEISKSSSNRGMAFESAINTSNEYYMLKSIALINKRTTPINVVKVDYSSGKPTITNAYFEKQSTTDYNGVYKGKYIDFEAKSTRSKTSFPLANIQPHQINHIEKVIQHGGIAFFIIEFELLNEIYLLDGKFVIQYYRTSDRKSIPYGIFKTEGVLIEQSYNPPVKYIDGVNKLYF